MLQFLFKPGSRSPRILLLGAHCDDVEIGCGGALLGLVRSYPEANFTWVTFASDAERAAETREAALRFLAGARSPDVRVASFRASYFPHQAEAIKDYFETLKPVAPDLIFTHFRNDLHQDHRVVNELTWNTFRDHTIFEYEIPKYDGDLGAPNVFVPLAQADIERKCNILLDCFASQRARPWFTGDTFKALARLRGIECNAHEGFAEAFYARKVSLCLPSTPTTFQPS